MRRAHGAHLVRDHDAAVRWFTEKPGFMLIEDAAPPAGGGRVAFFFIRTTSPATPPR
jgi:hypothetical protein